MCSLCVAFSPMGTSPLPRQEEYPHDAHSSTRSKNRGCLRRPRRLLYPPISSLPLHPLALQLTKDGPLPSPFPPTQGNHGNGSEVGGCLESSRRRRIPA
ncbi:hypothetical protein FA13DRAFT_1148357 [Coprinellus micaceus]|uniref:Uncharacterized protein n=1 Tax=Coprinellus micaceus TaxID=71717 RepID=A0A4Y7SVG1_COPMI|nr:hypothetical protein FA13DRAFT_1148357 [Coprinellus micaceus]